MSPFSFPTNLFSDMMQEFSIERNGEVIETAKGFFLWSQLSQHNPI